MASIELKSVTVREGDRYLLNDVSFKVEEGEYLGLLGPSGEGPSYILQVIAGLLPVYSGKVLIDGRDMTNAPPEDRHVGFIFEQFNLFPHLNVLDNLLFGPRMRREDIDQKTKVAKEIISMVRLDGREDAFSKELSGGMQQRVGIARAVTAGAKIILLDQPYRALDAKIREEMRYEIREIVKELKLTAIHSTHEMEEAFVTSDRIAIFQGNELQQIGTPEIVYGNPKSIFVMNFLAESNIFEGTLDDEGFRFGEITLKTQPTDLTDKCKIVIPHQSVELLTESMETVNIFNGRVTEVRILGEFIRFKLRVGEVELISKQMLDLRWENPESYLNRDLYIKINPTQIRLFQ